MAKSKQKTISPFERWMAYQTYLVPAISSFIGAICTIWFFSFFFNFNSIFFYSSIRVAILFSALSLLLFFLFIGKLKKWKWVKIVEYILIFIGIALLIKDIVIGKIDAEVIGFLVFFILLGIVFLVGWIWKLFNKK